MVKKKVKCVITFIIWFGYVKEKKTFKMTEFDFTVITQNFSVSVSIKRTLNDLFPFSIVVSIKYYKVFFTDINKIV